MTSRDIISTQYYKTTYVKYNFNPYIEKKEVIKPEIDIDLLNDDNPYIDIDNFDYNLWINSDDFNNDENNNDNKEIENNIVSLFDDILNIINQSMIDKDELTENFRKYMGVAMNSIQYIINLMFDSKCNFDPIEKFMWIYLMLACKYEPCALKYLLESKYFENKLMLKKDKYGYSPLFHLCSLPLEFDINLISKFITVDNLNEIYFYKYPLIVYCVRNANIFKYVLDNVESNQSLLSLKIPWLALLCEYNPDLISLFINHKIMNIDYYNTLDNNGASCLMYAINNADVFELLVNCKYCNIKLFNYEHSLYGNILDQAISFNLSIVDIILKSEYLLSELFATKNNILIDTCNNPDLFLRLIKHNKLNKNTLFDSDIENILNHIAYKNNASFKILLNNSVINELQLITPDYNGISTILLGILDKFSIFISIYASKFWKPEWLNLRYMNTGKTILMLLLESNNESKHCFVQELYKRHNIIRDETILSLYDNENYNTFWYFCKYLPNVAIDILKNIDSNKTFLSIDTIKKICYHCDNKALLNVLITPYFLSIDTVNINDEYYNNFLMDVCYYNVCVVDLLIDNGIINRKTLTSLNVDSENALMILLKNCKSKTIHKTLRKLISSEFMNTDILNSKNYMGEFPFIIACEINYRCAQTIMNSPYFDPDNFKFYTLNGENCFSHACKTGDINLIKNICSHKFFTQEIFGSANYDDIPYIYHGLLTNDVTRKYILNHEFCSTGLLKQTYKLLLKNNVKNLSQIIKSIIDSIYCNENILFTKDNEGNNCLALVADEDDLETMNSLIKSSNFNTNLLLNKNNNGQTCLNYIKSCDMLNLFLNIPGFPDEIISYIDNDYQNVLNNYILHEKYHLAEVLIKSNKCTVEIFTSIDNNGKCIIVDLFKLPEKLIETILLLDYLRPEDMLVKDSLGNTCLHILSNLIVDKDSSINSSLLEKYINCSKFSKELFELKNNDGQTFLSINPLLLDIVLKSMYCTKILLKSKSRLNTNLIIYLYLVYPDYIKELINHSQFDETFLLDTIDDDNKLNVISHICMYDNGDILNTILDSDICNNNLLNIVDEYNYTPLVYTILINNNKNLMRLLNSKYDFTYSFNKLYNDNKNLLTIASLCNVEIFKNILNSKYVTSDMLYVSDKYKHNLLVYVMSKGLDTVKTLFESKLWTKELMSYYDIDNDCLMIYPYKYPEVVEYIIKTNNCSQEIVLKTNNYNMNCCHYYANYNHLSLRHLLSSSLYSPLLLMQKDKEGNTPLHYSCKYNINSLKEIIRLNKLIPEMLSLQNNKGENCLMLGLKTHIDFPIKLFFKYINRNLLSQQDGKLNNLLFYSVRYNLKLLKWILKSNHCDKEYLNMRNQYNYTCYEYSCIYNGEAIKYLLNNSNTDNGMLYSGHMDYGSCLTLAAMYQPIAIKYILNWDKLSWKIINTLHDKKNFVMLAAINNPDGIRYIIDSIHDFTDLFKLNEESILMVASRYQPDAVKHIIESKYCSKNYLLYKYNDRSCIDEAYDFQPKALGYILNSKYNQNDNLLDLEDERGYKLYYRIKTIYPFFSKSTDINKISLVDYNNEIAKKNDTFCNICYIFKPVVIFQPCFHMCCIGCAFKLKRCHQCRGDIIHRQVMYN